MSGVRSGDEFNMLDKIGHGRGGAYPSPESRFANIRAAHHWHLRMLLEHDEAVLPRDERLAEDLLALEWSQDSKGRILMLSKDTVFPRGFPAFPKVISACHWQNCTSSSQGQPPHRTSCAHGRAAPMMPTPGATTSRGSGLPVPAPPTS